MCIGLGCPKAGAPVTALTFAVFARVGGWTACFTAPTADTTPPRTGTEPTTVRAMVAATGFATIFPIFFTALNALLKMLTIAP